jgi:hypothetical protein
MLITPKLDIFQGVLTVFPIYHLYLRSLTAIGKVWTWSLCSHSGCCMVLPCSPQSSHQVLPYRPFHPPWVWATQPFISRRSCAPSLITPSTFHAHRAAPLLKLPSHVLRISSLCHAPSCFVLFWCVCLHSTVRLYAWKVCCQHEWLWKCFCKEATSVVSRKKELELPEMEVRNSCLNFCQRKSYAHWQWKEAY